MKTFCANGQVDTRNHFFVSPEQWNEKNLIPVLQKGTYASLIAPSQTGKTTRVSTLLQQLNRVDDNILALYIDTSRILLLLEKTNFLKSFIMALKQAILRTTNKIVEIQADNWESVFAVDAHWFDNKKVILIMDEFDVLEKVAQQDEVALFLTALRIFKQDRSSTSLLSVLVVTNHLGSFIEQTIGNSPYNVTYGLSAPYFTQEEVNELLGQYEDQEQIKIEEDIKKEIYKNTAGAQGLTVMYAANFDALREEKNKVPDYPTWINYIYSVRFMERIKSYINYSRMIRMIQEDEESKKQLMQKYYFGTVFKSPILINSNALLENGEFASPFVRSLLANTLYSVPPPKEYEVPVAGNQVDMLQVIFDAIPYMNQMDIAGQPKKKSAYCSSTPPDLGPKEIVYVLNFKRALELLLSGYIVELQPEYPVENKSCDMLLNLRGERIAIEHGANLKTEPKSHDRMSVEHHVKKQAELYHKGLNATQTWVINWTTVPNGEEKQHIPYYFPESETVKTVYVYHNRFFNHIQIVSAGPHTQTIELPLPDFSSTNEPSKKRRKMEGNAFNVFLVRKYEQNKGSIQVSVGSSVQTLQDLLKIISRLFEEDEQTRVALRTLDDNEVLVRSLDDIVTHKLYRALTQKQEEEYK